MEKTLKIDGKDVRFKVTGAVPMRYGQQFGTDFFKDVLKMAPLVEKKKATAKDISLIDFEVFYNIAWTFAKTADKTIPDPIEWLDLFSEFPMMDIIPELQELLIKALPGKKK